MLIVYLLANDGQNLQMSQLGRCLRDKLRIVARE